MEEQSDLPWVRKSWRRSLESFKPYAMGSLLFLGVFVELLGYFLNVSGVLMPFFSLIIVIAGLWYGRKAVFVALFFGMLQVIVSRVIVGYFDPGLLFTVLVLVIVAFLVGSVVEVKNGYRRRLETQYRDLSEVNERLAASENAFELVTKKLNLLSEVTRHDIRDQLMALTTSLEHSRENVTDPGMIPYIENEQAAVEAIRRQIEFTRYYEDIGVSAPQWQDVTRLAEPLQRILPSGEITLSLKLNGLEVYADTLLGKVFENLVENSLRHGERVRHITVSTLQYGLGDIAIVYEDDGIGIHEEEKERIFEKGFGKNTGLGLFLSRAILAITGFAMKESGTYGNGVRFEIIVPKGKYRFCQQGPA
ncbi:MAG: HAMP domain-containing sensor histidine kinase [Methanoregula sp.]|nr:HAMP domain-containing sensor histidine kinase [Methanoregula sp.]